MTSEQTTIDGLGEHVPLTTKTCPRCRETRPVSAFGKNRSRPDGLTAYCRECMNTYQRDYHGKHKNGDKGEAVPPPAIGGTAASRAEEERRLTDLALRTRNWAISIDACVNGGTGHHGYFTVQEWMNKMGQTRRVWARVIARMYQLGIPITKDNFVKEGSYYIGTPADQGKHVASMAIGIATHVENLLALIQAIQESGDGEAALDVVRERLASSRHEMNFEGLARLGDGIGMKLTPGLERLLLGNPPAETA